MNKLLIYGIVFLLSLTNAFALADSDVLLWYNLDNSAVSGASVTDVSGNGYTGTITSATTGTSGKINQAFTFASTSQVVDYATISGVHSYSLWFKPNVNIGTGTTNRILYGGDYENYRNWLLVGNLASSSTDEIIGLYDYDGADDRWYWTTGQLGFSQFDASTWYHIVVSWDVANSKYRLWVNGADKGLAGNTETPGEYSSLADPFVGRSAASTVIDEFALFSNYMTQTDVDLLYNSGVGNSYPLPTDSGTPFMITSNLGSFVVSVNNTEYSTTNGTIVTGFLDNETSLLNIKVAPYALNLSHTFTNYNLSNPLNVNFDFLSFTATRLPANTSITTFDTFITATNYTYLAATTNGTIRVPSIENVTYTLFFENDGYQYKNISYEFNITSSTYNWRVYTKNSAGIYIREEGTGNLILDTVTLLYNNITNTTNTGYIYIDNFPIGTTSILFSSGNYSSRTYTITVGNNTYQTLTAYLIASGTTENSAIFTVKDKNTQAIIEGATISVSRIISGSPVVVDALTTDITGRTEFEYEQEVSYSFTISMAGYTPKLFTLDPILFASYTIYLQENVSITDDSDYSGVSIFYSPKTFVGGENNSLSYTIASSQGDLSYYGYIIKYKTINTTLTGTNAYGEALSGTIDLTGAVLYDTVNITHYYVKTDGVYHSFSFVYNIQVNNVNGTVTDVSNMDFGLGAFEKVLIITIFLIIVAGTTALYLGSVPAGVVTLIMFGVFVSMNLISIWYIVISGLLLFVIIAWRSTQ